MPSTINWNSLGAWENGCDCHCGDCSYQPSLVLLAGHWRSTTTSYCSQGAQGSGEALQFFLTFKRQTIYNLLAGGTTTETYTRTNIDPLAIVTLRNDGLPDDPDTCQTAEETTGTPDPASLDPENPIQDIIETLEDPVPLDQARELTANLARQSLSPLLSGNVPQHRWVVDAIARGYYFHAAPGYVQMELPAHTFDLGRYTNILPVRYSWIWLGPEPGGDPWAGGLAVLSTQHRLAYLHRRADLDDLHSEAEPIEVWRTEAIEVPDVELGQHVLMADPRLPVCLDPYLIAESELVA